MITLKAEKRTEKNLRALRGKNIVPAVLYGPKIESVSIQVDLVEFEKTHREAGDSLLVTLNLDDKDFLVLIRDTQFAAVSGIPVHIDFYIPPLKEKVEVDVPVIFDGESLVVKNFGGILVKHFSGLPVKAFPQSLPKQINVDIDSLKTFDDKVLISDLKDLGDFEIMKDPNDIVASISRPESIKEESEEEEEKDEKGEETEDTKDAKEEGDVKKEDKQEDKKGSQKK